MHIRLLCAALAGCLVVAPVLRAQEDPSGGEESRPATEEQKKRLGALVPAPADLSATLDGPTEFYTGDLFNYIDGGAPPYFDLGFECLVHQGFKAGEIELKVDVYDMGQLLQAFGIYAAERSDTKSPPVEVGSEAIAGEAFLYFYQDRYYVKLESIGKDKEASRKLLESTAAAVSKRIGSNKSKPPELSVLPSTGLIPHSQLYQPKAPLAMESLAPALRAKYRIGEAETTLWISLAPSEAEAKARAEKLRGKMKAGTAKDRPEIGSGAFESTDEYSGAMLVAPQGKRVLIFINPPKDPSALIKECAKTAGTGVRP